MKYVIVSGGVISGIGKGVIASSTGLLLRTIGLKVTSIKIDPYMNVDAGTMAPAEHGECFVLNDGGEVDLDLGNYERFVNLTLTKDNNITTGKIYDHVIRKERRGDYLGKTVQVVPHVTDAIEQWIEQVASLPADDSNEPPDACIIELGGTVGDIESGPFIEALRSLRRHAGKNNFLQIHVSLVPVINGEQKTKPTQQAIRDVRHVGLSPDLIACRCEQKLEPEAIIKIAHFCQVDDDLVVGVHDVESTYHVPMLLETQGLLKSLGDILDLDGVAKSSAMIQKGHDMWTEWKTLVKAQDRLFDEVSVALVGKYMKLRDSYLSVVKALEHAAMHCGRKLNLTWINSEHLEPSTMREDPANYHKAWQQLCTSSAIIVPGGFGSRGTEGMVAAANWARTNKIPYLGICLGLQIAVIEFARNVCGKKDATSKEFDVPSENNVIIDMHDIDQKNLGGTMRKGLHPTIFKKDTEWSKMRQLYGGAASVLERHRHRFEVNPAYIDEIEAGGLQFVGRDEDGLRMEVIELKDHPYYVGVQFHPEYLSKVVLPSPPYIGLVAASAGMFNEMVEKTAKMPRKASSSGVVAPVTNGTNGISGHNGSSI